MYGGKMNWDEIKNQLDQYDTQQERQEYVDKSYEQLTEWFEEYLVSCGLR
jgi:hypothetical protein